MGKRLSLREKARRLSMELFMLRLRLEEEIEVQRTFLPYRKVQNLFEAHETLRAMEADCGKVISILKENLSE